MDKRTRVAAGLSERLWDVDLDARTCTCVAHGPMVALRVRARRDRRAPELSCLTCDRAVSARTTRQRWVRRYGLTVPEFEELMASQHGLCAICEVFLSEPQIDHCHATGRVRGLLCRPCNLALGNFSDDIGRLQRAVAYLQES